MVIGYSFQDEHINAVIERASREHGLGTYVVDLRGREVLTRGGRLVRGQYKFSDQVGTTLAQGGLK
jgi:hypothetical protein